VQEGYGSELAVGEGAGTAGAQQSADGAQEDAEHGGGEGGVAGQEGTQAFRQGEDPLSHGQRGQDGVAEVGGDLDHSPGVAGGTDRAPLAGEGDQALGAAIVAAGAGEAVREDAAAQVGAEVFLDPPGNRVGEGVGVRRVGEKALEMVLDDGGDRGDGRVPAAVHGVRIGVGCSGPP
jgi:hypothetical protein